MRIGVIILCRLDSSRLHGKALKKIYNRPIIEWIYTFINECENIDEICVATSNEESDDLIEEFCLEKTIKCFRGSKNDVSLRFLNCAKKLNLDYAIRINGDNLFVESSLLSHVIEIARNNSYDFISNVDGRTFPSGMSVELIKIDFYENIYNQFDDENHFEHVTLYLYQNPKIGIRMNIFNEDWKHLRGIHLAIDTNEDFDKAKYIFSYAKGDYRKINFSFLNNMAKHRLLT